MEDKITRDMVRAYQEGVMKHETQVPDCFYDCNEGILVDKNNIEDWLKRHGDEGMAVS